MMNKHSCWGRSDKHGAWKNRCEFKAPARLRGNVAPWRPEMGREKGGREVAVVCFFAVMLSAVAAPADWFRFPDDPARDSRKEIPGRVWRIIGRVRRFRPGRIVPAAAS